MLKYLYIKNYVLIDELSLDLENGFSAFTGETGAGKSILIDAISLLCAGRASSSQVAHGKEKAIVEGTFSFEPGGRVWRILNEAGFEPEDEVVFTREIYANGKSTARIDRRTVTLAFLRECLEDEIDIHGQRDTAYLLRSSIHVDLLDEYASLQQIRSDTAAAYRMYKDLEDAREKALSETYNESDLEFLQYQIDEIEDADLQPGEDEELAEKERQYRLIKANYERIQNVLEVYRDSVSDALYDMNKVMSSVQTDDKLEEIQTAVNDSYYTLSDAMTSLERYMDGLDLSEEEINAMQERLYILQKLKRKYGRTIEDILSRKEEMKEQIERIRNRQEYLDKMDRKIRDALKEYQKKAGILSARRREAAPCLDRDICRHLQDLMLENAVFVTSVEEGEPSLKGSDRVEFLISMNRGEPVRPLSRTASGGELSRLMLGLKVIFTRLQKIHTVIFDEIDTGVSGPVATAIGRKMHTLSGDCQVFAVTHLAQVAACADHQYLVHKDADDSSTHTTVSLLGEEERIRQLALIASGEITDTSVRAAEELYRRNRS